MPGWPERYTGIFGEWLQTWSDRTEIPGFAECPSGIWDPGQTDFWGAWDTWFPPADGHLIDYWPPDDTQEVSLASMGSYRSEIIVDGTVWKERSAGLTTYIHQYLHAVFNATYETIWAPGGAGGVEGLHCDIPVTNSEGDYNWALSGEVLSFVGAQLVPDNPKVFMVLWAVSDVSINLSGNVIGVPPVNDYGGTYPVWPMIPSYTDPTKYYITTSDQAGETDYLIYEGDYGELEFIHLGIYEWSKEIPVYIYSVVKDTNAKNKYAPANQKMSYGIIFKGKHYRSPDFPMEISGYNPLETFYSQYFHRFVDGGKNLLKDSDKILARGWFKPGRLTKTQKYKRYIEVG